MYIDLNIIFVDHNMDLNNLNYMFKQFNIKKLFYLGFFIIFVLSDTFRHFLAIIPFMLYFLTIIVKRR